MHGRYTRKGYFMSDYRKYATIDQPRRTIELKETTEHSASSYGQPVLVDREGNAWDQWMVIPVVPGTLSRDAVRSALTDAIASEKDIPQRDSPRPRLGVTVHSGPPRGCRMITMMHVVSARVVFGDDLPGSSAAQVWDRSRRRWLYVAVFADARRGVVLDPRKGTRRWYRDVETLVELIEAVNSYRMVQSFYRRVTA